MIKAIETRYKGYRFRSRLEARWAVFFDKAGVPWEYESQGFDMDGVKYLPDFYLPKHEMFVEIKPLMDGHEIYLNMYLAGKIGRRDWRHDLVPNLRTSSSDDSPLEMLCGHVYTGPFFTDMGGHGQGHGESLHGAAEVFYSSGHNDAPGRLVVQASISQIDACDVLFAWIDDTTAYGTLVEIGMARAKNKLVWIGFYEEFMRKMADEANTEEKRSHDLWFAEAVSSDCVVAKNPGDALRLLSPPNKNNHKAEALASASGKYVIVLEGTPDPKHKDYRASMFSPTGFRRVGRKLGLSGGTSRFPIVPILLDHYMPDTEPILEQAMSHGRMARFEHGENGGPK